MYCLQLCIRKYHRAAFYSMHMLDNFGGLNMWVLLGKKDAYKMIYMHKQSEPCVASFLIPVFGHFQYGNKDGESLGDFITYSDVRGFR